MGARYAPKGATPNPWDRQPGEGPQAFRAFAAYRDSGAGGAKRSLQKTAESLTKSNGEPYSVGTLKEWSRKWGWQARVDAWDDEQDREVQRELVKGIASMRKNHVGIAKAMLSKSLQALQRIPVDELAPSDIARLVDVAAKLERISRGEVTERTEGTQTIAGEVALHQIDLSNVTDEELAALDEIAGKILTG